MSGSLQTQTMLCGDEIRAAIVDMGSLNTRFGAAGQELPRHLFKSSVGIKNGNISNSSSSSSSSSSMLVGDTSLRYITSNVDIIPAFGNLSSTSKSGLHLDRVEALIHYGLKGCMRVDPTEYPLFFTDSNFTDNQRKMNLVELCFEKFHSPAMFVANSAMLSLFSTGRSTGLVIDIGASGTRISPVIDGFVMKKSMLSSSRGGDWIDRIVKDEVYTKLSHLHKMLLPWYEAKGLSRGMMITNSFKEHHIQELIRDIKQWMCFVPYNPISIEARHDYYTSRVNIPPYELPDGTYIVHSDGLCSGPEKLFVSTSSGQVIKKPRLSPLVEVPSFSQPYDIYHDRDSLHDLVYASVGRCDVDSRKELLSNIVVVGGCSVMDGVTQRLNYELTEIFPSAYKPKLVTMLPMERHNSAWIGASILSICGTFQQMWLSKSEYEEFGSAIVPTRFTI